MTLRFFYQRSVKTNSKFGILILVIMLTTRLIECQEEATEAPAGGGQEPTEATTEEANGAEEVDLEPIDCPELYSAEKTCSDMLEVTIDIGQLVGKACLIKNDHIEHLCQLIDRCQELDTNVRQIFNQSLMPKESDPQQYVKRNASLICTGKQVGDTGQMLVESLWLVWTFVGVLMIYLRYN